VDSGVDIVLFAVMWLVRFVYMPLIVRSNYFLRGHMYRLVDPAVQQVTQYISILVATLSIHNRIDCIGQRFYSHGTYYAMISHTLDS